MSGLRLGSLFSGAGGLDLGVSAALAQGGHDTETVWVSDIEPGPKRILAERFPHAPNLGDIAQVDWKRVEPVDVLVGGFPCQDVSTAGLRAGLKDGTRSGLWSHYAKAIDALRPRLVVIENVPGLLSAPADSDVEPCPWCVGDQPTSALRGLGAVCGDLATLGYDTRWQVVSAASIGAPHRRERVFVVAYPRCDGLGGLGLQQPEPQHSPAEGDGPLLPTPCAQQSGNSPRLHLAKKPGRACVTDLAILVENDLITTAGRLLPTPTVGDLGGPEARSGQGFNPPLGEVARLFSTPIARDHKGLPQSGFNVSSLPRDVALLPTPSVADTQGGHKHRSGARSDELLLNGVAQQIADDQVLSPAFCVGDTDWGDYAPAVHRWEQILGRPAPEPTQPSKTGKPQLAPAFVEWMMGLPEGWVTGIDVSRARQLRALGNGVVPAQAQAAVLALLAHTAPEALEVAA